MDQLASYVHRNRELPCPANPAEDPESRDFGTQRNNCNAAANTVGIVPFRTLNLDERDARDAWGRLFTYAVSPVFANPDPANDNQIYYRCLSPRWINDEDNIPGPVNPLPRNENAQKARFCCPPPVRRDQDLVILDAAGNPREPAPGFTERSDDPLAYGQINTETVGVPNSSATAFAAVIVSHGNNGLGAYNGDSTAARSPTGGASATEQENADDDITYIDRTMVLEDGADYFDDVVVWRTQTSLYSELNNASCFRPWR
jgi:hypothetical protein